MCIIIIFDIFPHQLSGIIISASLVDSPHFGRIFTQCGGYLVGGAMVFLIGFEFPSAIIVVLAYMSRLSIMAATVYSLLLVLSLQIILLNIMIFPFRSAS